MNLVNLLALALLSIAAGLLAVGAAFGVAPLLTDSGQMFQNAEKLGLEIPETDKDIIQSAGCGAGLLIVVIFAVPAAGLAAGAGALWWWGGRHRSAKLGTVKQRVWFGRLAGLASLSLTALVLLFAVVVLVAAPTTKDISHTTMGVEMGPRDQWLASLMVMALAVAPGVFGVGLLWLSRRERLIALSQAAGQPSETQEAP